MEQLRVATERLKIAIPLAYNYPGVFKRYANENLEEITYRTKRMDNDKGIYYIHKPDESLFMSIITVIVATLFLSKIERKYSIALLRERFAFKRLEKHFKSLKERETHITTYF